MKHTKASHSVKFSLTPLSRLFIGFYVGVVVSALGISYVVEAILKGIK